MDPGRDRRPSFRTFGRGGSPQSSHVSEVLNKLEVIKSGFDQKAIYMPMCKIHPRKVDADDGYVEMASQHLRSSGNIRDGLEGAAERSGTGGLQVVSRPLDLEYGDYDMLPPPVPVSRAIREKTGDELIRKREDSIALPNGVRVGNIDGMPIEPGTVASRVNVFHAKLATGQQTAAPVRERRRKGGVRHWHFNDRTILGPSDSRVECDGLPPPPPQWLDANDGADLASSPSCSSGSNQELEKEVYVLEALNSKIEKLLASIDLHISRIDSLDTVHGVGVRKPDLADNVYRPPASIESGGDDYYKADTSRVELKKKRLDKKSYVYVLHICRIDSLDTVRGVGVRKLDLADNVYRPPASIEPGGDVYYKPDTSHFELKKKKLLDKKVEKNLLSCIRGYH
ncbi:hypothetical protein J6590_102033 [Homalodisca vitripennis]|nr:hypothetical protein J6590_102033 [Homalodisca vitripennis]